MMRSEAIAGFLRRHPLAVAAVLSLALHGVALAGAHFLLQGDGPAPTRAQALAFVVIETPTPAQTAPVQAPPAPTPAVAAAVPAKPVLDPIPVKAPPPAAPAASPIRAAASAAAHRLAKPLTPDPTSAAAVSSAPPFVPAPPSRRLAAPAQETSTTMPATSAPATRPMDAPLVQKDSTAVAQEARLHATAPAYGLPGLANPHPGYPWLARQRGEQGRVVLRVGVDAEGRAVDVAVAASSGHGRLDRAAAEAIRQWRFQPARRGGRAVPGTVDVPITFRLSDG